ncbi:MAG: shikimate dehydrogenase [Rhodanobacter sp.]
MKIEKKPSYLVGLIGAGIQASLTPAMHEGEGDRRGLRYMYRLMDLDLLDLGEDPLPQLLDAAQMSGFCGLNITHPCKQSVIPLLDELSDNAAAIGAVNTVVFRDGRRIGHNTDCWGFEQNMRENLSSAQTHDVVLLGAGGAGAAVAHALLHLGTAHVHVHDLDAARTQGLVEALSGRFGAGRASTVTDLRQSMDRADGIVHATPTGMAHYPGLPLPAELLKPSHWVAEIVYFPLETQLLALARSLGCKSVDGRGMAVHQAARAFRLFTGVDANAADMLRDFDALVALQAGRAAGMASAA